MRESEARGPSSLLSFSLQSPSSPSPDAMPGGTLAQPTLQARPLLRGGGLEPLALRPPGGARGEERERQDESPAAAAAAAGALSPSQPPRPCSARPGQHTCPSRPSHTRARAAPHAVDVTPVPVLPSRPPPSGGRETDRSLLGRRSLPPPPALSLPHALHTLSHPTSRRRQGQGRQGRQDGQEEHAHQEAARAHVGRLPPPAHAPAREDAQVPAPEVRDGWRGRERAGCAWWRDEEVVPLAAWECGERPRRASPRAARRSRPCRRL